MGARLAVEELRGVALDGALEPVRARAVLPEGDGREPCAERAKHLHRSRVGRLLDGDHVARVEQGARDQVEALLGAVDDEDVVGPGLHAEAEQVPREEPAERRVTGGGVVLEQLLALLADDRVQHPAERVRREHRAVRHAAGERDQPRGQAPGEGSEPPPLPFAEADPRAPREEPRPVDRLGRGVRARAVGELRLTGDGTGDERALPDVRPRQAGGDQLLVREGHRRAVHAQLARELPRGRQLDPGRQQPLVNQPLQVRLDLARERDRLRPVDRDLHRHSLRRAIFDEFEAM